MSEQITEIRREPVGEGAITRTDSTWELPPAEPIEDDGQYDLAGNGHSSNAASSTPLDGEATEWMSSIGDQWSPASPSISNAPKRRGRRAVAMSMPISGVPDDTPLPGHSTGAPQSTGAGQDDADHVMIDARYRNVASSDSLPGQKAGDSHKEPAGHSTTVGELVALARRRSQWTKAVQKLVLQEQAICRSLCDGDKDAARKMWQAVCKGDGDILATIAITPLISARAIIEYEAAGVERMMKKSARSLPVFPWVKDTRGFGELGFACLVGAAGDLSNYSTVSKLWKRMGLAVVDGGRQRRVTGDSALEHGYAPHRRSLMWNIGNGLIGGMGRGKRPLVGEDISIREDWSPYERLFVERLRIEADKDPTHRRPDTKDGKESYSAHAANRAKRYVEKRMLRDLWVAWRRANRAAGPKGTLPAAPFSPQGDAPGHGRSDAQPRSAGGDLS